MAFSSHGGSVQSLTCPTCRGPGAGRGEDAPETPLTRSGFFLIGSLPADSSSAFQKSHSQLSVGHPSGRLFGGYAAMMLSALALGLTCNVKNVLQFNWGKCRERRRRRGDWDHTLCRALVLLKQSPWLLGTILDRSPLRHRIPACWHSFCRTRKDDRKSQPHLVLIQQTSGI